MNDLDIKNWVKNIDSLVDTKTKTNPNFGRQDLKNNISTEMATKDWESETRYFNHYRVNGKVNYGRTITLKK